MLFRSLSIEFCIGPDDAPIERIGVDATMPAHRHGMNYLPSVTALGPGRWRAEGFLLHMPGVWRLAVEIRADGRTRTLTHDILVK